MEISKLVPIKNLEPYFKIAELVARTSPCSRRQYGAVIASEYSDTGPLYSTGTNERVGKCCNENDCARTRLQIFHGQRVEVGGEIHGETAALISHGKKKNQRTYFVLVGFAGDKELLGRDVWPCHSCAMHIKFAGFNHIFIRNKDGLISPQNITEVIEQREAEWEPADNDA